MFIYWTFLGVFDALVFFFGAYFIFENTTVTVNGQVSTAHARASDLLFYCLVISPAVCSHCVGQLCGSRLAAARCDQWSNGEEGRDEGTCHLPLEGVKVGPEVFLTGPRGSMVSSASVLSYGS